jgi:hypothetical protein
MVVSRLRLMLPMLRLRRVRFDASIHHHTQTLQDRVSTDEGMKRDN